MPLPWLRRLAMPAMGSKPQVEAMQLAPKPVLAGAAPLGAAVAAAGEAGEAEALAEEAGTCIKIEELRLPRLLS